MSQMASLSVEFSEATQEVGLRAIVVYDYEVCPLH
jgi:hypothetical protein